MRRPTSSRLGIFVGAMIVTFVVVRLSLTARPNADFFVAGYNVHHLFTGFLILCVCVVPLLLGVAGPRLGPILIAGCGVGMSLGLDEVVYLIATDGSNAAYLTRVSWYGALVLIGAWVAYSILLVAGKARRQANEPED